MKEFIEKLIGRLEEVRCGYKHSCIDNAYQRGAKDGAIWTIIQAISIVNRLAEEYINTSTDTSSDYCEWKLIDEEANVYDTSCRNPHILLEGSPIDNNYEFCPYCGRKIKV